MKKRHDSPQDLEASAPAELEQVESSSIAICAPKVAIIGRTNVGKSTLFNLLAGKRIAIVKDSPGVTRDRLYRFVDRWGQPFILIDTGGLVGEDENPLAEAVRFQAEVAIAESDLILAVFDGKAGLHPEDREVVETLRASRKPVLWIVNKCEKQETQLASGEFYQLGLDELIPLSAAYQVGLPQFMAKFDAALAALPPVPQVDPGTEVSVKIALIGRPNVGKSSLFNALCGAERAITSDLPGTTRDALEHHCEFRGRRFTIVDTAGLRKRTKVEAESVERFSNLRALKSVAQADVVCMVLDATNFPPSEQELRLAGLAHERGKCLVFVVNKWDLVEKDQRTARAFTQAVHEAFKFARYAPVVLVSAKTGRHCVNVLKQAAQAYDRARMRVKTSELNKVLNRAFQTKAPPVFRGDPVRLHFATQVGVAPPTIVLFLNHPRRISFAYERYVKNAIREHFDFSGVDIKIEYRKRKRPGEEGAGETHKAANS